jgi:hypothetical protein
MRVLCSIAEVCVLPFFEGKVLTSSVGERAVGMFARVDLSKKSSGFLVFLAVRSQFSLKMMRYFYRALTADFVLIPAVQPGWKGDEDKRSSACRRYAAVVKCHPQSNPLSS